VAAVVFIVTLLALPLTVGALSSGVAVASDCALPPGDSPPSTAFTRLAEAGDADDHPGADHIIVYDLTESRVKPSGVTYVDGYVLYKMLTPAGCRDRSVLRWSYEPWSSFIEITEVNIVRGEEMIPVDVSNVRDLPAPQSGIYWNSRIKTLQLPRLEVDDGVEVRVFRKGYSYALLEGDGAVAGTGGLRVAAHTAGGQQSTSAGRGLPAGRGLLAEPDDDKYIPPMPGEYFDIVLFQASVPVVEKRYELTLPADKRLHSQTYNGPLYASTTYSDDTTTYTWWAEDVPATTNEPRSPDMSDRVPKVVVATVESWEAKSRWFFDVNEDQFDVTPGIQAKVDEILRDAGVARGSDEEKAEVLVHWVAQNIRYSGQTMGEGEGFTLHSGAMIFEQRSGVCKDIAGMLVTMMRAAGMDSYAAMTMAGSRIEEVPADQFNHCVCALRKDDGSFEMYDPTWVPYYNEIWSKYETEQQYLTGTPAGEPLDSIPYSPPEGSPLSIRHEAELSEDGTLRGTFKLSGAGAMDSRLRGMVSMSRLTDIEEDIAYYLSELGEGIEIVNLDYRAVDDFSGNAWIEIEYVIPEYAFSIEDGLEFRSPMAVLTTENGWLCRSCVYGWGEERESDIFLWFTQLIEGEETIRLPRAYSIDDPPSSEEIDETFAYFKAGGEADGRKLTVTERLEVRRRLIPSDEFDGFKAAVDEALDWAGKTYRAEKGGDS
jgi:hypothetical protein